MGQDVVDGPGEPSTGLAVGIEALEERVSGPAGLLCRPRVLRDEVQPVEVDDRRDAGPLEVEDLVELLVAADTNRRDPVLAAGAVQQDLERVRDERGVGGQHERLELGAGEATHAPGRILGEIAADRFRGGQALHQAAGRFDQRSSTSR